MEKKSKAPATPESSSPWFLYGITGVILCQGLTFIFVNLWHEWRLDSLRLKVAQKGELLAVLETSCQFGVGQPDVDISLPRGRRQAPTMTDFLRDFLSIQEKALESVCVRRHDLCIHGPKGETGIKGLPGQLGAIGPDGIAGTKGEPGPSGSIGAVGNPGPKGLMGPRGDKGPTGARGIKGDLGQTGDTGIKGSPGDTGTRGVAGATGDKGDPGYRGDPGPKGPQGPPGPKGEPGPVGPSGAKGQQGPQGIDGILLHQECLCLNDFKLEGDFTDTVNVSYGAPLTLHCHFNMMNVPVTWSKDGGPISSRGTVQGNDLVFSQVLTTDGGTYHCSGPDGVLGSVTEPVNIQVGPKAIYDCDFETRCSWTNSTSPDKLDWSIHTGRTPSLNTGPDHDHTLDNVPGHYIYLESSKGASGDNAFLESQSIGPGLYKCLTFWYHMYGNTMGNIFVELKHNSVIDPSPIKALMGNQGNTWHLAKINLPPQSTDYHVIINGVRGSSHASDMAIDDIVILDGPCR